MDFTDASLVDVNAATGEIRHGIMYSLVLGLLGIAVAAGGYAYDQSAANSEVPSGPLSHVCMGEG